MRIRRSRPGPRAKVLLGPYARAWRSRTMSKKFQQLDGIQELTRLARDFIAAVKGWTRGALQDEQVDANDLLGRVKELAALYRLGEMPSR